MNYKQLPWSQIARACSIGCKFIILSLITASGSSEIVADYAIGLSVAALGVYILGLELYYSYNRMYMSNNIYKTTKATIEHSRQLFSSYLLLILPFYLICTLIFNSELLILAVILYTISEQLNLEIYRYYAVSARYLFANILLFLRSIAQVTLVAFFLSLANQPSSESVFFLMAIAGAPFLAWHAFIKYKVNRILSKNNFFFDPRGLWLKFWQLKYIFIGASIAAFVQVIDKKSIELFLGTEAVAQYSILFMITMTCPVLVQQGRVLRSQQVARKYFIEKDFQKLQQAINDYFKVLIVDLAASVFIVLCALFVFINITDSYSTVDPRWLVGIFFGIAIVQSIQFFPHMIMYISNLDMELAYTYICQNILSIIYFITAVQFLSLGNLVIGYFILSIFCLIARCYIAFFSLNKSIKELRL